MSNETSTRPAREGLADTVWNIVLWVLAVIAAVGFVRAGYPKLAGEPGMVALFETIGLGQWFRYLTGILEVAGGIGLLVPRVRALAALGLVGVMIGAMITNAALGGPQTAALIFLVLVAVIAWGRRRELRPSVLLGRPA